MLEELEVLARTGTVEARGQIIDHLTELMCVRVATMSNKDRDAFGDVFAHLLASAPIEVRVGVAKIAATIAEVPLRLLVTLAHDEMPVATPVLMEAKGLGEVDLEALAASLPPSHLLCLAQRPDLPETVTNRLVARGDMELWARLAGNASAHLSKSSLTTLSELCVSDLTLRGALASRHDLPEPILDRLWPFLSLAHKQSVIAAGFTLTQDEYDALVADGIHSEGLVAPDEARAMPAEAMRKLVDECAFITLAEVLAAKTGYHPRLCLAVALGNYERGGALLVRACDGDAAMLDALRTLRSRIGSRPTGERRRAERVFEVVTREEAHAVLAGIAVAFEGEGLAMPVTAEKAKSKSMADAA